MIGEQHEGKVNITLPRTWYRFHDLEDKDSSPHAPGVQANVEVPHVRKRHHRSIAAWNQTLTNTQRDRQVGLQLNDLTKRSSTGRPSSPARPPKAFKAFSAPFGFKPPHFGFKPWHTTYGSEGVRATAQGRHAGNQTDPYQGQLRRQSNRPVPRGRCLAMPRMVSSMATWSTSWANACQLRQPSRGVCPRLLGLNAWPLKQQAGLGLGGGPQMQRAPSDALAATHRAAARKRRSCMLRGCWGC